MLPMLLIREIIPDGTLPPLPPETYIGLVVQVTGVMEATGHCQPMVVQ